MFESAAASAEQVQHEGHKTEFPVVILLSQPKLYRYFGHTGPPPESPHRFFFRSYFFHFSDYIFRLNLFKYRI